MTTTAAGWGRSLHNFAVQRGLPADALFRDAGISPAQLADSRARLPQENLNRVWDALVAATGDAGIGLDMGRQVSPASFGAVGYLMLSCATVREALQQGLRYQRYLAEALRGALLESADEAILQLDNIGARNGVRPQVTEAMLAAALQYTRWVLQQPHVPLRVEFRHAPTVSMARYEDVFGCAVQCNRAVSAIYWPRALLEQALPGHDPWLQAQHQQLADALQQDTLQPITARVRALLRELLGAGPVEQTQIAELLHLTPKTLQRRLEQEGSRFRSLLDDTRFELACQYLRQPAISLQEVSALCGYSDYSAFAKGFRGWCGQSPGDWRAQSLS